MGNEAVKGLSCHIEKEETDQQVVIDGESTSLVRD